MVDPPKTTDPSRNSGESGGSNPPKPDHKDPYYTSSSDLPGNIITPIVLRSTKYDEWARSILLYFTSRKKITFLEGTEIKPVNDPDKLFDWRYIQAFLVQWLLNTIDPTIKKQFLFMRKFLYGRCLRNDIVRAMLLEPLPSLDTAYQKIREEESLRKASDAPIGNEFVALSSRSNPRMRDSVDMAKLWCTHCKKQGHEASTRWVIRNGGRLGTREKCIRVRHPQGDVGLASVLLQGTELQAGPRLGVEQLSMPCSRMGMMRRGLRAGQDQSARMVIGAGERRGGLSYFCELPVTSTTSLLAIQTPRWELWHS
ncbi:hypothetical protein LIER_27205 [Lithospermum erythrorhizon]|uniref:Retrotransposon Copia-like N-terminal domain-containing protein n=1 Tax=Lithospermum erythrorhizon TaxID=34254 RepID=A0AAV3RF50_LITER